MTEISKALLAAQKAMPAIHKDSKAEVPTKSGGKFSYTYLSLQGLLEVVLPVLNENGLALTQMPGFNEAGRQILRTSLFHESGETLVYDSPLIATGNETPQAWGGAVTYARRYALTALLGIAADEDDDGAAASKPASKPATKKTPPKGEVRFASGPQMARIYAIIGELAKQRGVDPEQVRHALKGALGIESMAKLTVADVAAADALLAEWQKKVGAAA